MRCLKLTNTHMAVSPHPHTVPINSLVSNIHIYTGIKGTLFTDSLNGLFLHVHSKGLVWEITLVQIKLKYFQLLHCCDMFLLVTVTELAPQTGWDTLTHSFLTVSEQYQVLLEEQTRICFDCLNSLNIMGAGGAEDKMRSGYKVIMSHIKNTCYFYFFRSEVTSLDTHSLNSDIRCDFTSKIFYWFKIQDV